jgi:hypothetical protein
MYFHCQQVKKIRARFWRATPKTGLFAPIFFAALRQKRISATIPAAWASSDFAKQNRDQPLAPHGLLWGLTC